MEAATRGSGSGGAAVVGGGLIGVEMAEMLHSRGIAVTFLVREALLHGPRACRPRSRRMVERGDPPPPASTCAAARSSPSFCPDEGGRVRALRTRGGAEVACDFVGLTIGVEPNVGFLPGPRARDRRAASWSTTQLRTSLPEVYAAGDCAQLRPVRPGRRAIEPLWYVARRMGETVAHTICGSPLAYEPGGFFNSAKFFDLEWQIYGRVPGRLSGRPGQPLLAPSAPAQKPAHPVPARRTRWCSASA